MWVRLRERAQMEMFPELPRQRRVRPDDAAREALSAAVRAFEFSRAQAAVELAAFLARLRAYRVLDPACGSGNFLYLSLLALKDLELRVATDAEALGLQRGFLEVGPEAVLGIEINPYAAELARVSVWIGHIQWARRHGLPPPENPVLRALDTIECRDAILAPDGTPAAWPAADAIVGNPPFLGGKRLRSVLGDAYCEQLFAAYAGSRAGRGGPGVLLVRDAHAKPKLRRGSARRLGRDEQHSRWREPASPRRDRARCEHL